MAVKWTGEQQKVIDTRDCDILVSAAAGSGKTAVLVARILDIITDEKKPVDIDRLLVVTFTNAAAAEMRERIRDALEKRAEEEPDNVHLQRQLVLVHNAKITTIHSFCLHVLRNHFQMVGIDPSFRVADEGEVLLLEQETVKETVEEAYANWTGDAADFETFLESLATGKSDYIIEETVLALYHFALGQPWPREWLQTCAGMYEDAEAEKRAEVGETAAPDETSASVEHAAPGERTEAGEIAAPDENSVSVEHAAPGERTEAEKNAAWFSYIAEDTARILADTEAQLLEALRIAEEPDGPYPYCKALESDIEMVRRLRKGCDYASYAELFRTMPPYARLGTKKDDSISPEKKQLVQGIRSAAKDMLSQLRQQYYYDRTEVLRQEFFDSGANIRVLARLTELFMERLAQKKAEKNLLDFSDLEHLALQALVERSGGENIPTAAAREYAEHFEEVMVDEYQDSNLVQELILKSVSGRGRGEHNLFMVGDVKQSIYRFRLARPELFMEKYKTYCSEDTSSCRIDLHRNFRSRAEVLESVNYIFRQIMTENLGGIAYDADAALYPGAVFAAKPPAPSAVAAPEGANMLREDLPHADLPAAEFLLLEAAGAEKQQEEARLAGRRIQEMVGHELVWDKETEQYRPARYGDIVILLRTVSGWAETFGETLGDMGIPCFTGSQKGYFSAAEIRVVLSYLQILDNPVQDIPLAAVLRSAIGKITDEEMAKIRSFSGERYYYDCCRAYLDAGPDKILKEKLERFFAVYESLRAKCGHTPVHLLIWELLEVTGYGAYAEALPAGSQRKANLDMLVEKAIAYEATSYRGLYHFVRYIENLKKYEVDYGEANTGSEAADTVRIMSIHKSKGLEFPIVFVCGLGKQFNESDIRSRVVMHPEFGIACDYVDTRQRTRQATLLKKVIQQKTASENLGEELRVLYVAMTRAKEKLILTGSVSDAADKIEKWKAAALYQGETLSYSWLSGASSYLDWVGPALLRHPAARDLFEEAEVSEDGVIRYAASAAFFLHLATAEENAQSENQERSDEAVRLAQLLGLDTSVCYDSEARAYLERVFSASYPYEADAEIIGKLSVSELKKLSRMPEEEDAQELYRPETVIPLLPAFRGRKEPLAGAARGTAYHTFMENLDYARKDELQIQLEELISCGKMSGEEAEALRLDDVRRFLETGCGQRMERAALAGLLFREQPFVLGVPADSIRSGWNPQETVLVQGIIDAYFLEDERITVVDYKTDKVKRPQELTEKYRAQLDYYALALERLTGRKVKDCIIYSFHLGEDILL